MTDTVSGQSDFESDDPIWIDDAWLDTVVVIGLTCFILCLMDLSKVCHGYTLSFGHQIDVLVLSCIACHVILLIQFKQCVVHP